MRETASATAGTADRTRSTGVLGAARKFAVLVAGLAVLGVGVALIVLPGPAFLVIPAGLAILATEFPWARRVLRYGRERAANVLGRRRDRRETGGSTARPVSGSPGA